MLDFVFCGSELTDSWKRTKLNGKGSDLPDRISSVLNVSLDGYICNKRSYRDHNHSQQTIEQNVVILQNSRISPSVYALSKSPRHAMDQARTFCFDVIISTTIFATRKSAGGNMIGLNQQRKSQASSRSFGG